MKKNDWLLAISALSFSLLFYEQEIGLNALLLNIILILGLIVKNGGILRDKQYYFAIFAALATAVAVFVYGSALSFMANFCALSFLSACSISPKTSVFIAALNAAYSGAGSGFHMLFDYLKRQKETPKDSNSSAIGKWLFWIFPLILVLVFFALYRLSSPVFNQFSSDIDLSFISIGWIVFTLFGFWLSYGFFFHRSIPALATFQANVCNDLNPSKQTLSLFGYRLTIQEEIRSGMLLFILLNILLLVVNGLDFGYLISGEIPAGMSYSAYVHQGTEALIFSIIMAIGIITIYFRNGLSLLQAHKPLRLVAYAWLIQNLALVTSTLIRNQLYINEYSLTYKRIGVYVFLILAFIALLSAFIKIAASKSNYYLVRVNSMSFFAMLVFCALISWDQIIYSVNVSKAKQTGKADVAYLMELSYSVLPELQVLNDKYPPADTAAKKALDIRIAQQTFHFLKFYQANDWRSFNLRNYQVYKKLLQQNKAGKFVSMNFGQAQLETIIYLKPLNQLAEVAFDAQDFHHHKAFQVFPNLKTIQLTNYRPTNLSQFPTLPQLEHLSLTNGTLATIHGIDHFTGLKTLDLSHNQLVSLNGLEDLNQLEELNICNNPALNNLSAIYQLPALRKLYISKRMFDVVLPNTKTIGTELKEKLPQLEVVVVE